MDLFRIPTHSLPDLSFPMVKLGKYQAPWDLSSLLYLGGAGTRVDQVINKITNGNLGHPITERIALVSKIHDAIVGELTGGGSPKTAYARIVLSRKFFSWADEAGQSLSLETVANSFIAWTGDLLHQVKVLKNLKQTTAYSYAAILASLLDRVLEREVGLLFKTRLRRPKTHRRSLTGDKQNLEHSYRFGTFLLDLCDGLTNEAMQGELPAQLPFRSIGNLAVGSSKNRNFMPNIRISAEMLIFISMTGINYSQASKLKAGQFRYISYHDGYQVHRVFKGRRQGEVAFEIYSDYRIIFERYLKWRASRFSEDPDGLLFPFIGDPNSRKEQFVSIRHYCRKANILYIGPQTLRKTRVNWMLRRSKDLVMTAEMSQHSKEVLIRHYHEPNLQQAMIEISRFHAKNDPALLPPGPGLCIKAKAQPLAGIPIEANKPDCRTPAGCLFCDHHRDIDSADHVWSLASYRYLKSLELTLYRGPVKNDFPHPAMSAIERITAKLKHFESISNLHKSWVDEALARIAEEYFHPRWDGYIQLAEVAR